MQLFLVLYMSGCWGGVLTRGDASQVLFPWLCPVNVTDALLTSASLFVHATLLRVALAHASPVPGESQPTGDTHADCFRSDMDIAFVCGGEVGLHYRIMTLLQKELYPAIPTALNMKSDGNVIVITQEALREWRRLHSTEFGVIFPPEPAMPPISMQSLLVSIKSNFGSKNPPMS